MRHRMALLWILLCSVTSVAAQVSVEVGLPSVGIGINVPAYPALTAVPGYPVYYAPQMNSNYFFYDGMFWVYQQDSWYASTWYNGPWGLVPPEAVPLFILRVPVRYYRQPPGYFGGWSPDASPRWGEHWGNTWEQSRSGWDSWNRNAIPPIAPLPAYQRQYAGNRYPRAEQQQALQSQNYHYQPQEAVAQQHYQAQRAQRAPAGTSPATGALPKQAAIQRPTQQPRQAAVQHPAQQPAQAAASQPTAHPKQAASQRPAQQPQHAVTQKPAVQPRQAAAPHPAPQSQQVAVHHQDLRPQQAGVQHEQQASKQAQEKGEQQGAEHNK
jgi:hypothetical protein